MSHEENPFASPQSESADVSAESATGIWREGNLLVVSRFAEFPDRCTKCNEPAEGYRLKRNFSWHHPIFYLGLLLGVLPYLFAVLLTRNVAKHQIGLCPTHRSFRKKMILISWLTVLAAIGMFIFSIAQENGILSAASGILLFVAVLIGIIGSSVLSPKRIDKTQTCWLKGAGSDFIASFPSA